MRFLLALALGSVGLFAQGPIMGSTWQGTPAGPIVSKGCNGNDPSNGITTITCTFPSNIGVGNFLEVCVYTGTSPSSIAITGDNSAATWSADPGATTAITNFNMGGEGFGTCQYKNSSSGGSSVLTINFTSSVNFSASVTGIEVSGGVHFVQSDDGNFSNGATPISNAVTPAAGSMILGFQLYDPGVPTNTITAGSNVAWTLAPSALATSSGQGRAASEYFYPQGASMVTAQFANTSLYAWLVHIVVVHV